MDFFQSQDRARRNTGRLLLLFAAAVGSLILLTNLLVMVSLGLNPVLVEGRLPFDPQVFIAVTAVVLSVVVLGGLYKRAQLAGGGARVAEMLDGRLLIPGTGSLPERRVLNVVEEMALAAGIAVPAVYVLEEQGINAFAAGYSPADAVIGITRGALTALTRDELQGVIAHEFSHILHGDMRINIRLIAVLHGILLISLIGELLLRNSSRGRRSKEGGSLVLLGLGLYVLGYLGVFFGNLIKAAVSRQREFLADASAVQFTRNPEGIGHALMRIATHARQSMLVHPARSTISHALFEEGQVHRLSGLFATHPPLDSRIRAVLPGWDGRYTLPPVPAILDEPGGVAPPSPTPAEPLSPTHRSAMGLATAALAQVGVVSPEALTLTQVRVQQIPPEVLAAARELGGARAVVYGLLLDPRDDIRAVQLALISDQADTGVHAELVAMVPALSKLPATARLPLLDIALARLRHLSEAQYARMKGVLTGLIAADGRLTVFEWALQRIVIQRLDAVLAPRAATPVGRLRLPQATDAMATLLSFLARQSPDPSMQERAFQQGAETLGLALTPVASSTLTLAALNAALGHLRDLHPLEKPALLKACAAAITADGHVGASEVEVFRAVAETLDCPMPPLPVDAAT